MYFFENELHTQSGLHIIPNYFIKKEKKLVLIACKNEEQTLLYYISALRAGHAVMLLDAELNQDLLIQIIQQYEPFYIVGLKEVEGYICEGGILLINKESKYAIHPDTAVLLSTSGTTGSPKFVRLSYNNIQSNAEAIAEYLKIVPSDRAVLNLPLSYSYGMSIINSHMQVGATIVITNKSVMEKEFWTFMKDERITSLAGVPFTYQMLRRIGFLNMHLPDLKTLTQAGGRLNEKEVRLFAQYAIEKKKRFYVMYGQTEASPRMSYIPYENLVNKVTSIGVPIPGGRFEIHPTTEELIYYGPNVMMGYAERKEDLAKGDELQGILHTGDTAIVDEDGYYTITGRLKRFVKLFGLRINLDEVERKLESEGFQTACTGTDDKLIILTENQNMSDINELLQSWYKLHKSAFRVVVVNEIPRLINGKLDYKTIKELYS